MLPGYVIFGIFIILIYSLKTHENKRFPATTASLIAQIWSGSCRLSCRPSFFSDGASTTPSQLIPARRHVVRDCICDTCPCSLIEDFLKTCGPATRTCSTVTGAVCKTVYDFWKGFFETCDRIARVLECGVTCQRQAQLVNPRSQFDSNENFTLEERPISTPSPSPTPPKKKVATWLTEPSTSVPVAKPSPPTIVAKHPPSDTSSSKYDRSTTDKSSSKSSSRDTTSTKFSSSSSMRPSSSNKSNEQDEPWLLKPPENSTTTQRISPNADFSEYYNLAMKTASQASYNVTKPGSTSAQKPETPTHPPSTKERGDPPPDFQEYYNTALKTASQVSYSVAKPKTPNRPQSTNERSEPEAATTRELPPPDFREYYNTAMKTASQVSYKVNKPVTPTPSPSIRERSEPEPATTRLLPPPDFREYYNSAMKTASQASYSVTKPTTNTSSRKPETKYPSPPEANTSVQKPKPPTDQSAKCSEATLKGVNINDQTTSTIKQLPASDTSSKSSKKSGSSKTFSSSSSVRPSDCPKPTATPEPVMQLPPPVKDISQYAAEKTVSQATVVSSKHAHISRDQPTSQKAEPSASTWSDVTLKSSEIVNPKFFCSKCVEAGKSCQGGCPSMMKRIKEAKKAVPKRSDTGARRKKSPSPGSQSPPNKLSSSTSVQSGAKSATDQIRPTHKKIVVDVVDTKHYCSKCVESGKTCLGGCPSVLKRMRESKIQRNESKKTSPAPKHRPQSDTSSVKSSPKKATSSRGMSSKNPSATSVRSGARSTSEHVDKVPEKKETADVVDPENFCSKCVQSGKSCLGGCPSAIRKQKECNSKKEKKE